MAKDARSFKPEYLIQALKRLKIGRVPFDFEKLENLIKITKQTGVNEQELDELLGYDGPPEFYCPISSEIMREPVLLPTSNTICDFNTIKRHLLNAEHDPFNRAPLKITDLKEVPELKARVARWIQ